MSRVDSQNGEAEQNRIKSVLVEAVLEVEERLSDSTELFQSLSFLHHEMF